MADNISIGCGLMLQERFEEATDVFAKEHDLLTEKRKTVEQKDVLQISSTLRDIDIVEGYLFWAFGMAFWTHGKPEEAEKHFKTSCESFGKAYEDERNVMPFLVEHLLGELRRGKKALSMNEQLGLINEWEKLPNQESRGDKAEYARMWDRDSEPEGESINKTRFDALMSDKRQFDITIVMRNQTEVYVGEKLFGESLRPIHFSILKEAFINKGNAGDILNLLDKVYKCHAKAQKFADEMRKADKSKNENRIKTVKNEIFDATKNIRTEINRFNKFLNDELNLKVKLKTEKKREYKIIPPLNYLFIQLNPLL